MGLSRSIEPSGQISHHFVDGSQGSLAPQLLSQACTLCIEISECILLESCHRLDGALLTIRTDGLCPGFAIGTDLLSFFFGRTEIGLGLAQFRGGRFETGFGIGQLLEDRFTTTLKNAAEQSLQEINKQPNDNDQIDQVCLKGIEVDRKTTLCSEQGDKRHHETASRR